MPDGIDQRRNDSPPRSVEADSVDLIDLERGGVARRRVPADDHEYPGDALRTSRAVSRTPVVLQGVRAGDADDPRPRPAHPGRRPGAKAKIRHRRSVAVGAHAAPMYSRPKRFDAKERAETEPIVSRFGLRRRTFMSHHVSLKHFFLDGGGQMEVKYSGHGPKRDRFDHRAAARGSGRHRPRPGTGWFRHLAQLSNGPQSGAGSRPSGRRVGEVLQTPPFDVAEAGLGQGALAPLLETESPLVLVNNAGFSRDGLLVWMEEQEWKETLSVHLDGFFFVTKMVLFGMLKRRSGRIINIVSTSGQSGVAGQTNYSAAKAGLIGATRSLALEVAKRNILVNAVSPGFHRDGHDRRSSPRPDPAVDPVGADGETGRSGGGGRLSRIGKGLYITGQVFS